MYDFFQRAQLRRRIQEAHQRGALSEQAYQRALELVPVPTAWWWGVDRLLLALGTTQVLAGILFFFAFNWHQMPPWTKFASLQAVLLLCLGAGWFKGFAKTTGKVLLLAAAVLLGVLLAVFGQIYQTGADSYTLFLTWAILILPWTVMARFTPFWLLQLVVANFALGLYLLQVEWRLFESDFTPFFMIMAGFNGLILVVGESLPKLCLPRIAVWALLLSFAAVPPYVWAMALEDPSNQQGIALLTWIAILGSALYFFYYVRPDFHVIALAYISIAGLLVIITTFQVFSVEEGLGLLAIGLVVMAIGSATILFLNRLHQSMRGNS